MKKRELNQEKAQTNANSGSHVTYCIKWYFLRFSISDFKVKRQFLNRHFCQYGYPIRREKQKKRLE